MEPNDWIGWRGGQSKLLLKEMGSLIESWLSAGDYRRREAASERPGAGDA